MVPRQPLLETSATASLLEADSKNLLLLPTLLLSENLVGRQLV